MLALRNRLTGNRGERIAKSAQHSGHGRTGNIATQSLWYLVPQAHQNCIILYYTVFCIVKPWSRAPTPHTSPPLPTIPHALPCYSHQPLHVHMTVKSCWHFSQLGVAVGGMGACHRLHTHSKALTLCPFRLCLPVHSDSSCLLFTFRLSLAERGGRCCNCTRRGRGDRERLASSVWLKGRGGGSPPHSAPPGLRASVCRGGDPLPLRP